MANIPIEKKRKMPWWVWLLVAVVVALLLWWLLAVLLDDDDDVDVAAVDPGIQTSAPVTVPASPEAPGTPDVTGGTDAPVTDLPALVSPADPAALVGRTVQVETVPVIKVIGDYEMFVGSGDEMLFVVLDQSANPEQLMGRVEAGDQVSMSGLVRELPPLEEARDIFGLRDEDAPSLQGERVYLAADSVTVVGQ